jgi:nucleoside-diphosphate-sugar epimerase
VKLLVTGASGMLGRGTALALSAHGDDVTVLQRHASGLDVREVLGDIADPDVVHRAIRGQDAVVHLAAKVDVVGRWTDYHRVNVTGTHVVVDACRSAGTGRLVQVSSPSVAHSGKPLVGAGAGPADPEHARSDYARSKAMAERVALAADGPDLAVLAVRPHLVWGPGDTQLVGRLVTRAAAGHLPRLGSGAALIDTTFVDNAVDALIAALNRCGPAHGQALVVSNGEPRPIAEILARVCRAANVAGPSRRVPTRIARLSGAIQDGMWDATGRQDTPPLTRFLAEQLTTAHWFDQRRTREVLQWAPAVNLDEGFRRLASWYEMNPAHARGSRTA